ncbi:MAG: porin [Gammaproteobacteria bacterium]|nr:porin [Gammaproteobacteria bacterium]
MNKKLIALAVAAGVAMPMAAVHAGATVFGTVQQEIVSADFDNNNASTSMSGDGMHVVDGMNGGTAANGPGEGSGASSFGAKVTEELGNGMKALAKVNFMFDSSDGGAVSMRDSYVGLSGGFGTVLIGRMNAPSKAINMKWDPFLATFMQARTNGGMSSAYNSYLSNAIAYTNKFGPVNVIAGIGVDETNDNPVSNDADNDHAVDVAISAPIGPVTVVAAYRDTDGVTTTAATAADQKSKTTKLGVKWADGPMSAVLQFEDTENHGLVTEDTEGEHLYANFGYKMGKNLMTVAYGQFECASSGCTNDDGTYLAVGMIHSMSKNTRIHVGYRSTEGEAAAGSTPITDVDVFGLGVRVSF